MNKRLLIAGAMIGALALPTMASAQDGAATGAVGGAVTGGVVGGPVGAVVGGAAGAVIGGISDDNRPRFREYVVREKRPSYRYSETVRVGATLPSSGVTYYEVPREYGQTRYRYTIVNERPVLVDPDSRAIVQIVE